MLYHSGKPGKDPHSRILSRVEVAGVADGAELDNGTVRYGTVNRATIPGSDEWFCCLRASTLKLDKSVGKWV